MLDYYYLNSNLNAKHIAIDISTDILSASILMSICILSSYIQFRGTINIVLLQRTLLSSLKIEYAKTMP